MLSNSSYQCGPSCRTALPPRRSSVSAAHSHTPSTRAPLDPTQQRSLTNAYSLEPHHCSFPVSSQRAASSSNLRLADGAPLDSTATPLRYRVAGAPLQPVPLDYTGLEWIAPERGEFGSTVDIKAQDSSHRLYLGIILITLAFFCAAVMSTLSKAAAGVPPLVTLFLQYGISLLVFVPSVARAGRAGLKTEHFQLQLFRSVAGSACQLLFFMAVRSTPLLDAVLLSNAAPLFIPLVVYCWFGKTVRPPVWLSLMIGLAGIVLIIKPGPQMFHNPSSLLALTAGFFSALALVATNKLTETEPPSRILLYNFGLSTVLLAPLCLWAWIPLTARQWLLLLGVGVSYALTQYLIIRAYRYASAAELSPFNPKFLP